MISFKLELKWACIFTSVLLIWMVLERLLGWHDELIAKHQYYTLFFYLPAVLIYYLSLTDKRNNFYGGIMTYRQGFVASLILTLLIAAFAAPAQYLISTYITPDYFKNVISYAIETGQSTPDAAQEFFSLKNYMLQSVLGSLVIGLIFSAILPLIVRRK